MIWEPGSQLLVLLRRGILFHVVKWAPKVGPSAGWTDTLLRQSGSPGASQVAAPAVCAVYLSNSMQRCVGFQHVPGHAGPESSVSRAAGRRCGQPPAAAPSRSARPCGTRASESPEAGAPTAPPMQRRTARGDCPAHVARTAISGSTEGLGMLARLQLHRGTATRNCLSVQVDSGPPMFEFPNLPSRAQPTRGYWRRQFERHRPRGMLEQGDGVIHHNCDAPRGREHQNNSLYTAQDRIPDDTRGSGAL